MFTLCLRPQLHRTMNKLVQIYFTGYGSVLTKEGEIELEALVVEGKHLAAGEAE